MIRNFTLYAWAQFEGHLDQHAVARPLSLYSKDAMLIVAPISSSFFAILWKIDFSSSLDGDELSIKQCMHAFSKIMNLSISTFFFFHHNLTFNQIESSFYLYLQGHYCTTKNCQFDPFCRWSDNTPSIISNREMGICLMRRDCLFPFCRFVIEQCSCLEQMM